MQNPPTMHASQLLVAWLAVLALPSAAAQPAAEQAVGPATSPARAPGAFQQPLKVGVGLLSVDNFPFSQKTANASAPDNHAGLEGFEVGSSRRAAKLVELLGLRFHCTAPAGRRWNALVKAHACSIFGRPGCADGCAVREGQPDMHSR